MPSPAPSPVMEPADRALECWRRLMTPEHDALRAAAAEAAIDPAGIAALRRRFDAELVPVALELAAARRAARGRLACADRLVADRTGVEQATGEFVATHKAARFAALRPGLGRDAVIDGCCGIGGDAMALARSGPVRVVDRHPVRAWMAATNAEVAGGPGTEVRSSTEAIETVDVTGSAVHLDPARRSGGRRRWRYDDYEPGPAVIESVVARAAAAAVKLGPGVDLDVLPAGDRVEIELISVGGSLTEAVLWTGPLATAPGLRRATRLPSGASFAARPGPPRPAEAAGPCLHVPDPALERAGLLGILTEQHGLAELHPGLGLLTGDPVATGGWTSIFEILDRGSLDERRLRRRLRAFGAGIVEVKVRGRAADADRLRSTLRGVGDEPLWVFTHRLGRSLEAIIARRLEPPGS